MSGKLDDVSILKWERKFEQEKGYSWNRKEKNNYYW